MIASGLQIYMAFMHFGIRGSRYFPNPWDGKPFPPWSRLGGWLAGGLSWHFALAWPFVITGLLYLGYLAVTGEWRSLVFRPSDIPRAVADAALLPAACARSIRRRGSTTPSRSSPTRRSCCSARSRC